MLLQRAVLVSAALAFVSAPATRPLRAQRSVSSSFSRLVARLSEPNGYFDSDNIITNEVSYLHVASQLAKVGTHGGVYIGVGPDQNFSYIALIKPKVAFMLDVRRDNLLEHLLFKSIFAMSRNRLEYLCLLLGKRVPSDIDRWTGKPIGELLAYLGETPADSATALATKNASNARITAFGVPLDAHDREMIDRYRAQFVTEGLDTRYSSLGRHNRNARRSMPAKARRANDPAIRRSAGSSSRPIARDASGAISPTKPNSSTYAPCRCRISSFR